MLDTDTKRRIDTARDILVGKVPDPKSQVEQITIALIYKFMDDMDAEAVELGGKRKFFKGEFAPYGWAELMKKAGNEKQRCYADGITRMTENEGLPALFRDIFKNAYLPYRDPETLNAFLKIIDEFRYDHSERLGDAFEYLLSVLGSQGDAGQFRTPRHIIDFMVEILKPQKHETVLDPACGTAGFLISAYKHILKTNRNAKGQSTLTPDDKGKLAKNFKGYDISPDMVRLSLVNLYLHGFTDPHIYEYDSLTQEERWNELADVILANPPFMSPKGGIRPHKRFSIQAKRSEVLFVDYMAEHLTPQGRAGIIVPEGIIFQSQTAYVELRKMLVDTCLVAVISLPAGCFNPYSGVKTSILLLDKALAKQSDTIAFFKVENDGFGLGAQRRAIEANDLPQVQTEVEAYLEALRAENDMSEMQLTTGLIVPKSKVAANGDYNLSGERYREGAVKSEKYPSYALSEVCDIFNGSTPSKQEPRYWENGTVPWFTVEDIRKNGRIIEKTEKFVTAEGLNETSLKLLPKHSVLLCCTASVGEFAFTEIELTTNQQFNGLVVKKTFADRLLPKYLFLVSSRFKDELIRLSGKTSFNFVSVGTLKTIEIPLPPLEVQQEIVAEIEGYQKVIDGARAVLNHYRPHIPIHPDWPMVELGEVCEIKSGGTPSRSNESFWNGDIPWVTTTLIDYGIIEHANEFITKDGLDNSSTWIVPKGTVLMAMYGQGVTRGRVAILGIDASINQACAAFMPKGKLLDHRYLFRVLQSRYDHLREISEARGGTKATLVHRS
ncbi:MAG: N-6 DNA methylase [Verrucomicrobiaceae bacterium]|nr:N-6 DNA methylase [Verrucomicrobiaceae bacterium]